MEKRKGVLRDEEVLWVAWYVGKDGISGYFFVN